MPRTLNQKVIKLFCKTIIEKLKKKCNKRAVLNYSNLEIGQLRVVPWRLRKNWIER